MLPRLDTRMCDEDSSNTKILAIDVCGTLYQANTTLGFVETHHELQNNRVRGAAIKLISDKRFILVYLLIAAGKLLGRDFHRLLVVFSLRGEDRQELLDSAEAYYDRLQERKINAVHRKLDELITNDWQPILVSNSLEPIIRVIAGGMKAPFISSELGWREGRCTGRIAKDITGRKKVALESHIGHPVHASKFRVVTDNRSDEDLIQASARSIVVLRKTKKNWADKYDVDLIRT